MIEIYWKSIFPKYPGMFSFVDFTKWSLKKKNYRKASKKCKFNHKNIPWVPEWIVAQQERQMTMKNIK